MFKMPENHENQLSMERYMRNQFKFLGLKTPQRKAASKDFIKESKQMSVSQVMEEIADLYKREEREYQYVAIDIAYANVRRLSFADIQALTHYVQVKSWWDTVDTWRKVFATFVILHPSKKQQVFELFYQHPNFWMRRVSVILQLLERETLDTELLTRAIEYDIHTDEFFIQKAIGWALRNYSKFNPDWVRKFVASHDLSKLAVREGTKYVS